MSPRNRVYSFPLRVSADAAKALVPTRRELDIIRINIGFTYWLKSFNRPQVLASTPKDILVYLNIYILGDAYED